MTPKRKIEFHGKEMSLFEAKLYLLGINYGIINVELDTKEKSNYINEKEREKDRGLIARNYLNPESIKKAIPRLNEKKYLSGILERKIKQEESLRKAEYCAEYGHKRGESVKSWMASQENPTYICKRCNAVYEDKSNKIIPHPFETSIENL